MCCEALLAGRVEAMLWRFFMIDGPMAALNLSMLAPFSLHDRTARFSVQLDSPMTDPEVHMLLQDLIVNMGVSLVSIE